MATRLWTCEQDLGATFRTNGAIWEPADAIPDAGGLISFTPDRWGVRPLGQAVVANQVYKSTLAGFPSFNWPLVQNSRRLQVAEAFSPVYWLIVMAYNDGLRDTFLGAPTIIGANATIRVIAAQNTANLFTTASTSWAQTIRKNAGPETSTVLPMKLCIVEIRGPASLAQWAIGGMQSGAGWQGDMAYVNPMGVAPTGDTRDRCIGSLAHRFGIAGDLPVGTPYRDAAPTVEIPAAKGTAPISATRAGGSATVRVTAQAGAALPAVSASASTGVKLTGYGGAAVDAIGATGFSGLGLPTQGGALISPLIAGGLAVADIPIPPRRFEIEQFSANRAIGPDGVRLVKGDDGRRLVREA